MTQPVEINKTYLVVLALHRLGGESDLESIAVKAHEMFPQQFCWRSYPQFPDKDAVRVHLSEAKKKSFGGLVIDKDLRHERRVEGSYTKRFALTAAGLEKVKELVRIVEIAGAVSATEKSIDYRRLVDPIIESDAFQRFRNGMSMALIGRDRFLLAFRLYADASPFVITGRVARAEAAVDRLPNAQQRNDIKRFIQEGRSAYAI
jgi:hypothetical protein